MPCKITGASRPAGAHGRRPVPRPCYSTDAARGLQGRARVLSCFTDGSPDPKNQGAPYLVIEHLDGRVGREPQSFELGLLAAPRPVPVDPMTVGAVCLCLHDNPNILYSPERINPLLNSRRSYR